MKLRDVNLNTHFGTLDIALIAIFSALYVAVNLILGPLSFQLLGLPILHDIGIFSTLLLVAWITERLGASIAVAFIGSAIAILFGAPPLIIGFAASAIPFDILLVANHHKIRNSIKGLVVPAVATILSAYAAGVIIGVLFMRNGIQWALSIWGGWHMFGGVLTITIILPIIVALEKANVRKLVHKAT